MSALQLTSRFSIGQTCPLPRCGRWDVDLKSCSLSSQSGQMRSDPDAYLWPREVSPLNFQILAWLVTRSDDPRK